MLSSAQVNNRMADLRNQEVDLFNRVDRLLQNRP
jgi:hypothetical protein